MNLLPKSLKLCAKATNIITSAKFGINESVVGLTKSSGVFELRDLRDNSIKKAINVPTN